MAKKLVYTTNTPSSSTDYAAADGTWKTMGGGGGGTVTSVALTAPTAFNVTGSPITTNGTIAISGAGTASQYVKGDGTLGTTPTSLPPSGSAGGDLSGTYPNPTVSKIHGVDMQSGTPSADEVWVYGGSPAKWQHQKLKASQTTNDSTVGGTNVDNALDNLKSSIALKQDTITGAATTIALTNLTTNRAVISNGSGKIAVSTATDTEIGYLSGVTSAIQTQLNAKQGTVTLTTTGNSGPATLVGSTLNIPQYSTGYGLNLIQKAAYGYEYYNDFLNLSANILTGFSDGNGIQAAFSGTGTTVTSSIAPAVRATNQHGFMQPTTGSSSTSYAGIHMSTSTALLLGGGAMTFNTSVLFNTASTSSERYRAVIGYANTVINGAESNGIFFTYDEGGTANGTAASPNWQCLTIANSVRTLTTTSTAVSFTAWQKLSIEINAAGTSVQFFVDNTLVATHTTNIPSGTSQLIFPKIWIGKTIGTTSRYYHCDYIYYSQTYTTQKSV